MNYETEMLLDLLRRTPRDEASHSARIQAYVLQHMTESENESDTTEMRGREAGGYLVDAIREYLQADDTDDVGELRHRLWVSRRVGSLQRLAEDLQDGTSDACQAVYGWFRERTMGRVCGHCGEPSDRLRGNPPTCPECRETAAQERVDATEEQQVAMGDPVEGVGRFAPVAVDGEAFAQAVSRMSAQMRDSVFAGPTLRQEAVEALVRRANEGVTLTTRSGATVDCDCATCQTYRQRQDLRRRQAEADALRTLQDVPRL